jgi:hypothetical protein
MAEDRPTSAALTAARCPWCSAEINPGAAMCASCGAALVEPDGSVPGVTAVDQRAISRIARATAPAQRSRLLSWLTGDFPDDDDTPAPPGSLAPPPPEVRREMLRLAMEAEYANLQAEANAVVAEAELESRSNSQVRPDGGDDVAATEATAEPADSPEAVSPGAETDDGRSD